MKGWIVPNVLTAAVYLLVGKAALSLALIHPNITAVWPPTGIAMAACLLAAYRVWPGILISAFVVNQTTMGNVLTSAAIAAGNTLEALLGAYLVQRFAGGRKAFRKAEGVLVFAVLGALLSTTVSATIGVGSFTLAGYTTRTDLGPMWLTWWLGNAMGALIVTPVVVLWSRSMVGVWPRRQLLEAGLVLGTLCLLTAVVFGGLAPVAVRAPGLEWLFVPVLTWAAVRLGPGGTVIAILMVSATALLGTLHGAGPFVGPSMNASLLLVQYFTGIIALTAFTLAAAVAERGEALAALQRSSASAIAAEERIRAETAEFLHSHVQSRLLMAWHRLRSALLRWPTEAEAARALVTQVADQLDEIRERDVRQASYLLHPSFIREGLTPAVHALTERLEGHVAVTVEVDPALAAWDTPIRNRLPEALRLAAFRILEEALGNVVRHAQASTVHITLGLRDHAGLVLTVADNGRGFAVDGVRPGLGLASIESRVRQVGGRWQISSRPGKGTTVTADLTLVPGHTRP